MAVISEDFIVKNGLQVNSNVVVGSYWLANAAPVGGIIISGNIGIGTAIPTKNLTVQNDISASRYWADMSVPTTRPTLNINFTKTTQLDDRVNIVRASNATIVNSNGIISYIGYDTPAYDYDPTTLQPLGLRIEELRTNYIGNNLTMGSTWFTVNAAIATNSVISPDGTLNAANVSISPSKTDGYPEYIISSITPSNTTPYTTSMWVKQGNTPTVHLYQFYVGGATRSSYVQYTFATGTVTGNVGSETGFTPQSYGAIQYPNGWVRLYMTSYDTIGTNTSIYLRPYINVRGGGTSGQYTYMWGAQVEQGTTLSSLIANNTSSGVVTRAADIVSMNPINSWFNSNQGMIKISASSNYLSVSNQNIFELITATTATGITVSRMNNAGSGQNNATISSSNASIIMSSLTNTWSNSNVGTTTVNYNTNTAAGIYSSCFNTITLNSTVNTTPQWTTPLDTVYLGSRGGSINFLNGYITNFAYYPLAQTNAVVQSFSI